MMAVKHKCCIESHADADGLLLYDETWALEAEK